MAYEPMDPAVTTSLEKKLPTTMYYAPSEVYFLRTLGGSRSHAPPFPPVRTLHVPANLPTTFESSTSAVLGLLVPATITMDMEKTRNCLKQNASYANQ